MSEAEENEQLQRQEHELDAYAQATEAIERISRFIEDLCACGAVPIGPSDKPQTLDGIVHDYWVCHHADEGP